MIELHLIKRLLSKEAFNKYINYIKVPQELKKHYKILTTLHESVTTNLSLDDYLLHARQEGCDYLDTLKESETGDESLDILLRKAAVRSWSQDLALLAVDVSEGKKDISDLSSLYDSLSELQGEEETQEDFVTDDINEILKQTDRSGGLQWRLPSLRRNLGGVKQGMFGIIYARSNTGKTTFGASEISFMAKQAEQPIIWFKI